MDQLAGASPQSPPNGSSGWKAVAWIGGLLATVAAIGVAAVLAVFFAATVLVIGLLGAALVSVGALGWRARKAMKPKDPTLIEAHNVGGHSWVAYGWDQRGR